MKKLILAAHLAAITALAAPAARASILTAGNFQSGTPTPTFSFGTPITLSITTTGYFQNIVFDEWVTSDGSANAAFPLPSGQTISYQINSGPVQTIGVNALLDNLAGVAGVVTPNDGALYLGVPIPVTMGRTLTILPGSLSFTSDPFFNPPPAVFNGNVFFTDNSGILLSASAAPEPGAWALLGVGACALGLALRHRAARV